VDDRRLAAGAGLEADPGQREVALLSLDEGHERRAGAVERDLEPASEHRPRRARPHPDREHDVVAADPPARGRDLAHHAAPPLERDDLGVLDGAHAGLARLAGQLAHGRGHVGPAAAALVQRGRGAGRAEVRP